MITVTPAEAKTIVTALRFMSARLTDEVFTWPASVPGAADLLILAEELEDCYLACPSDEATTGDTE